MSKLIIAKVRVQKLPKLNRTLYLITVPLNCGIKPGDYVSLTKVET